MPGVLPTRETMERVAGGTRKIEGIDLSANRPQRRRHPRRGGGGGGSVQFAVIKGQVPPCTLNATAIDPTEWTITPGELIANGINAGAVQVNEGGTLTGDPAESGDVVWLDVVNMTQSYLSGDAILPGKVKDGKFVIVAMDLWTIGKLTAKNEDKVQIPYHGSGTKAFELDGELCS